MTRNSPLKFKNEWYAEKTETVDNCRFKTCFFGLIRLFRLDLRLKSNPNGTQNNRKLGINADYDQ